MSKVDIIMATYNGEKYINEQINSIINQTYTDWNLIIRDDGSKDSTVTIIKEYEKKDKRIKLVVDDLGNLGYNKNFEKLLTHSTADYTMISDQDDIWNKNKIEISFEEIKKIELENKPALVFSDALLINNNKENMGLHIGKKAKKINTFSILIGENICQGATIMMNKKLKEIVLPFSEKYLYDYFIFMTVDLFGNWKFIKNPTLKYRIHFENQIGSNKIMKLSLFQNFKNDYYRYSVIYKKIKDNINFIKEQDREKLKDIVIVDDFIKIFDNDGNRIVKSFFYIKNCFFIKLNFIHLFMFVNILINNFKTNWRLRYD